MSQIDDIPEDAVLVTVNALGLYPSASHEARLKALKNALKKKRKENHIPTEKLINMAKFVLENNFFGFNGSVKQQVSGTTIGTKCALMNS